MASYIVLNTFVFLLENYDHIDPYPDEDIVWKGSIWLIVVFGTVLWFLFDHAKRNGNDD